MNALSTLTNIWLALSPAVTVGLLILLCLLWRTFSKFKTQTRAQFEKLDAQVSVLSSGSVGMGKKLLILEQRLARLKESQSELQHSNMDFSYTQAQRLITQGLPNEAIAANSGLSASEINLMRLLNSQSGSLAEHA